ncbi:MAG TPA: response regulator [Pyrinomonadaceae bacterium]|nr:response regulator [Pyrinomonadaceae bacterium]
MIEDQEDLAELYETTLKGMGYGVCLAMTGEEGVGEFQARGADVVLLDMTLPEMNGAEVLKQIREINASVPVIIITGETHEGLRQQCERLGVHDYLSKPVNYEAMLTAIKLALEVPPEESELVTLRLPTRVLAGLHEINPNLSRALTTLLDERSRKEKRGKLNSN